MRSQFEGLHGLVGRCILQIPPLTADIRRYVVGFSLTFRGLVETKQAALTTYARARRYRCRDSPHHTDQHSVGADRPYTRQAFILPRCVAIEESYQALQLCSQDTSARDSHRDSKSSKVSATIVSSPGRSTCTSMSKMPVSR